MLGKELPRTLIPRELKTYICLNPLQHKTTFITKKKANLENMVGKVRIACNQHLPDDLSSLFTSLQLAIDLRLIKPNSLKKKKKMVMKPITWVVAKGNFSLRSLLQNGIKWWTEFVMAPLLQLNFCCN